MTPVSFMETVRHRSGVTGDVVVRAAIVEGSRIYVKALVERGDAMAYREGLFREVEGVRYGYGDVDVCQVALGEVVP